MAAYQRGRLRRTGQANLKSCATERRRVTSDASVMRSCDPFDERKTEPCPTDTASTTGVGPSESLEDPRAFLDGDARTVIIDSQDDLP